MFSGYTEVLFILLHQSILLIVMKQNLDTFISSAYCTVVNETLSFPSKKFIFRESKKKYSPI